MKLKLTWKTYLFYLLSIIGWAITLFGITGLFTPVPWIVPFVFIIPGILIIILSWEFLNNNRLIIDDNGREKTVSRKAWISFKKSTGTKADDELLQNAPKQKDIKANTSLVSKKDNTTSFVIAGWLCYGLNWLFDLLACGPLPVYISLLIACGFSVSSLILGIILTTKRHYGNGVTLIVLSSISIVIQMIGAIAFKSYVNYETYKIMKDV